MSYEHLLHDLSLFPVSFCYNGVPCHGFGADFTEIGRRTGKNTAGETVTEISLRHGASGALFCIKVCCYSAFDAIDWTVHITNDTDRATGVFSELNAIDMELAGSKPAVRGIAGDCGRDMYKPYENPLAVGDIFSRESTTGRPSHVVFPYFDLVHGDGGTFMAIGWPGCWRTEATGTEAGLHIRAGQHTVATVLHPGQCIRTPLIALLDYSGRDRNAAANVWRRWFIECNMRKVDGKNMPPMFIDFSMSEGKDTKTFVDIIRTYAENSMPLDCYWMDAGWYTDAKGEQVPWPKTGSLRIDEKRFPDHFADVTKEVQKTGGMSLLWFEPEVVRQPKEEFLQHTPDFKEEWMLGVAFKDTWLEGQLLDLGNEDCRRWLLGRILPIMRQADIGVYRQDFNVDPGPVWKACDAPDQTGYTENQYVTGYLALWDAILEAMPHIWMDSCASGGGRNDLETMRRGVPLQLSDYWDGRDDGYDERQATMMTIMQWLPYTKFWMYGDDSQGGYWYRARSCYAQMMPLQVNALDPDTDWDAVRRIRAEWQEVAQHYYADYYPLTEWNNDLDKWRGFTFFDPQKNAGVAQLFRPENSTETTRYIRFYGLDPESDYHIYDTDGTLDTIASGSTLLADGLAITLPQPRYAMVLHLQGN